MNEIKPEKFDRKFWISLLGLAGFAASLTVLYLAMRAVMDVGGYCAEGGPYEIAVHCPAGVAWKTPLSIFGLFIFGLWYFLNIGSNINFGYLFWSALFGALGWNFLDYGIRQTGQLEWGWLICGVVFWIMAGAPLILLFTRETILAVRQNYLSVILQLLTVGAGIWLGGWLIY